LGLKILLLKLLKNAQKKNWTKEKIFGKNILKQKLGDIALNNRKVISL
jgi:hypothetical protein